MKTDLTVVELSPIEAKAFIAFNKHRTLIGLLESVGAFDIKSGSVTVHFSRLGEILSIDKQEHFSPNMLSTG